MTKTVAELIDLLKSCPADVEVYIDHDYYGLFDVSSVELIKDGIEVVAVHIKEV